MVTYMSPLGGTCTRASQDGLTYSCSMYTSLTLRFTASVDTSKLTSQVNGIKYGVPLPFPLPEPDSCKLGATCPVSRGESNEISITLPILSVYPSLNIDVRWIVYDDKNNQMVCFKFPVSIQG